MRSSIDLKALTASKELKIIIPNEMRSCVHLYLSSGDTETKWRDHKRTDDIAW